MKQFVTLLLAAVFAVGVAYGQIGFVYGKINKPSRPSRQIAEPEMVRVEGGTFWMGCNEDSIDDCEEEEIPAHIVTVSSFSIGKYEVTQALWKQVMGNNPSDWKGDNLPVEKVTWQDVQNFISRLNVATGKKYRLPTEAEWEFAARGGNQTRGYKYSGSDTLDNVGWYYFNSGKTVPVGGKLPNELGIYDMSGNVWEWCSDWFGNYTYSEQTDPIGASLGSAHVTRGGAWSIVDERRCTVGYRGEGGLNDKYNFTGFRLALP
ncbi:hypothetical protein FACS189456_4660 [Bacteroidia bacterium]|nr:hypothetical protein FACS189456_4660 [Bacteroidia bacterium]